MMTSRHVHLSFISVILLCAIVALTSCSKKDVKSDEDVFITEETVDEGASADSESDVGTSSLDTGNDSMGSGTGQLETVYFDFDRYDLTSSTRATLQRNADWLQSNSNVTVEIQGHCDERGTEVYNMALGERRAEATRSYLSNLGISRSRMDIVSYGEEVPSSMGSNESAWAQNRRAEFRVTSQ